MNQAAIEQHLNKVLASAAFIKAGRVADLLQYLVKLKLGDESKDPTQYDIAIDVFGRTADFDPGEDAIVRVEAGRLRTKLYEYYARFGQSDALRFELPKGGFAIEVVPANRQSPGSPSRNLPRHEIRYCQSTDGIAIAYSVVGQGYPLVVMPTWLGHLELDFVCPVKRHYWIELSKRFQLIRFDLRGFGLSERDIDDFSFDDLIADIETVTQHLGLKRFALLGPSAGALMSLAYSVKHPGLVSHLIFLGGFIRGPRRVPDAQTHAHADMIEAIIRRGWAQSGSPFSKNFCAMLLPNGTDEQYDAINEIQLQACDGKIAELFFRVISKVDLSEAATRVKAETLILHGDNERGVPLSEARYAASKIPKAKFIYLPTPNHILLADEPAWPIFLEEVSRFIAG